MTNETVCSSTPASALSASPPQLLTTPVARPCLLVVDDQAVNVQALYQAFAADHQILMATSGVQAIALCASKRPELVLLDVVMPGMDGYEVCRRLKADTATRDIPVIFVTAHNDEAAETLGLQVGAVDFISKPINPAIVRARVKTHLLIKRQSDQLRSWAYLDGLTGACNRRHFDEQLDVEWRRAARDGSGLAVVMIDIDYFKLYNDCYGHQAGDEVLRRVASAMQLKLHRPADLLARYGGEEFVCLLPATGIEGAQHVAQALRASVSALGIAHAASLSGTEMSISLGVACMGPGWTRQAGALLQAADVELYRAKSEGRNRVCVELAPGA